MGKLDGRLFQDSETGTKMVMEENTAKSYIATAKKEATMNAENLQQNKHNELRSSSGFVDPMDAKGVGRVLSNGNASASKNSSQSARIIKDVNYKGRAVCGPQATMTIPGIICCFCGDEQ